MSKKQNQKLVLAIGIHRISLRVNITDRCLILLSPESSPDDLSNLDFWGRSVSFKNKYCRDNSYFGGKKSPMINIEESGPGGAHLYPRTQRQEFRASLGYITSSWTVRDIQEDPGTGERT